MRKQDLYDYIELKIKVATEEARKSLEKVKNPIIDRIIAHVQTDYIDTVGAKDPIDVANNLEKYAEMYDIDVYYHVERIIRSLRDRDILKTATNNVLDRITSASSYKDVEIYMSEEEYKAIEKATATYNSIYNDLVKMEKELKRVVRVSSSAKVAYKNLIVVGLDMGKFEETKTKAMLPAVQLKPILGIEVLNK